MPVEPVELKWYLAKCDRKDGRKKCGWEGNPTPNREHAEMMLDDHLATVHAPVAAEDPVE